MDNEVAAATTTVDDQPYPEGFELKGYLLEDSNHKRSGFSILIVLYSANSETWIETVKDYLLSEHSSINLQCDDQCN